MPHTLEQYLHIVNGEIQSINTPHPLEGCRNKRIFIERLISHFDGMTYEDISGGSNKLFKIRYNHCEYNVYIEAFDGGGRDRKDGNKKISITSTKTFKELIDRGESVLIINEYVPLKYDASGNIVPDDKNPSVYGIIKPKEIYSSKVVRRKTGNPSSRWVSLETMIEALDNHEVVMNNKNNVYVIPSNLIEGFFKSKLIDEQYEEMAKYLFETKDKKDFSEVKIGRLFRDRLIAKRGLVCQFCNCKVDLSDQLVASHINARSNIRNDDTLTDEEKFRLMTDVYNGFILCRPHDAIFDKKHITLTDKGELIVAPELRRLEKEYNIEGYEGKKIIDVPEGSIKYLEVHRNEFCKTNHVSLCEKEP